MPQSRAANPISSQEDGSRCHQVTRGRAVKQSAPNPSTGCASRGKLTGSRNYPLKTHLKWKNILDIISRLFYRLANVTNVLGEKKTKLPGLQVSQVVFAGSNYPDRPFFKALHLKQFSPKPPFTEQKDKLGPSLAMHFNSCLTLYTVVATSSDVSPVLPTCSFFFLLSSQFLNFFFFGLQLLVQPSSLKKMAHTAQRICWISTSSCKRNPTENIRSFHIKSNWTSQGHYKKSTVVLEPSLAECLWIEDHGGRETEELFQLAQALCCSEDCWLRGDLDWPLLAAHNLTQCRGWNPALRKEPAQSQRLGKVEEGSASQWCQTALRGTNFTHSKLKGQIQRRGYVYLPVETGDRWGMDRTHHEHVFIKRKKKGANCLCFAITKECFTSFLLVSFYNCSPLAQGILCITRFN